MRKTFKRLVASGAGLALVAATASVANAEFVSDAPFADVSIAGKVMNPSGGVSDGDGLYIVFDRGSFLTYRNDQVQNYMDVGRDDDGNLMWSDATYNGLLLNWNGRTWKSPMYDNAGLDDVLSAVDLGSGELNTLSQVGDTYYVYSELYTDLNDSSSWDSGSEIKIELTASYTYPNEYFDVQYTVVANFSNSYPVNLYHGIDMYLDGADDGPASTDIGLAEFPGRYIVQQNPDTGAVGGFIEKNTEYSSYYADHYDLIVSDENSGEPGYFTWADPNRGARYGEPLPSYVTDEDDVDVGVGIHFSLGTPSNSTSTSDTHIIFASGIPGAESAGPEPIDGLDIISKGDMAVGCGDTEREITGEVENVTEVKVGGVSVPFEIHSDSRMTIDLTNAPTGIQDLYIVADEGEVNWQRAYDIGTCAAVKAWTSFNEQTNNVKIYAKNLVGKGKIQFFVDGKEVGWVRPIDASNPKLITNANGVYFVRTVKLDAGEKNRIEVKLNGERLVFNTYVPKD